MFIADGIEPMDFNFQEEDLATSRYHCLYKNVTKWDRRFKEKRMLPMQTI